MSISQVQGEELIDVLIAGADALSRDNRQLREELKNILALFEHGANAKDYKQATERAKMCLGDGK